MQQKLVKSILGVGAFLFVCWSFVFCKQQETGAVTPVAADVAGFVGDQVCGSCHAEAYADWKGSHHFHAMELPDSNSVRGRFDGSTFTADGVRYRMYQQNGQYLFDITENGQATEQFPVAYTFGWEPLQQYLVARPGGRYQTLRISWDTEKQQWFHQYPDTVITPGDWLHWTGAAQTWNSMCAACHSTHLEKNYIAEKDSFHTTWSIINVSCEACHGPGEQHVALATKGDWKNGAGISTFSKDGTHAQTDMCGACHGLRTQLTSSSDAGGSFLQRFLPELMTPDMFFRDGQQKGEVYKYASFLSSRMYAKGVVCSDCHQPHSGRLKLDGNALCMQCHTPSYDSPSHHFHPESSVGASCVNCHMPGKNYMVNDYRHDHSFRVPRPDQSAKYGTPNTCNTCHADRTAGWAAEQINKWYGPERRWHFSDALLAAGQDPSDALPYLLELTGRDSVPAIVRAQATMELNAAYGQQVIPTLQQLISDSSELVRMAAYNSMLHQPADRSLAMYQAGWQDTVLAVRLAAYRATADIPVSGLSEVALKNKQSAGDEYLQFLMMNADMANGQVLFSEYYQQRNDLEGAIDACEKALQIDDRLGEVRLNLAILYSRQGNMVAAVNHLKTFISYYPDVSRGYYYLSLILNEQDRMTDAIQMIRKALSLDPYDTGMVANYVLMLYKSGQINEARAILQEALEAFPNDAGLQSLIAFIGIR